MVHRDDTPLFIQLRMSNVLRLYRVPFEFNHDAHTLCKTAISTYHDDDDDDDEICLRHIVVSTM
jgi:hypothetical protein